LGYISRNISPSFLPRSKKERFGLSCFTCSRTVFEKSTNDVAGFFGPPCGILFLLLRPLVAGSPAAALPLPAATGGGYAPIMGYGYGG